LRDRLLRRSVLPQLWNSFFNTLELVMSSQKKDELDVFEMFYASVGPSLWDHLRQPADEDAPFDAVQEVFEEDDLQADCIE
tara:strand:+ start:598 stop:840 length:243 start_codon:yes stop_codon:yes gene_type:complete